MGEEVGFLALELGVGLVELAQLRREAAAPSRGGPPSRVWLRSSGELRDLMSGSLLSVQESGQRRAAWFVPPREGDPRRRRSA
ncbi:MAG: hypothetical protein SGPRY_008487 [Prymnesium sp.]